MGQHNPSYVKEATLLSDENGIAGPEKKKMLRKSVLQKSAEDL